MNPMLSDITPRILDRLCQSLPTDEQARFQRHQHPCLESDYASWILARRCAETLQAELRNLKHFKRVEVGAWLRNSGYLFVLIVVAARNSDWVPVNCYRGFTVQQKVEA